MKFAFCNLGFKISWWCDALYRGVAPQNEAIKIQVLHNVRKWQPDGVHWTFTSIHFTQISPLDRFLPLILLPSSSSAKKTDWWWLFYQRNCLTPDAWSSGLQFSSAAFWLIRLLGLLSSQTSCNSLPYTTVMRCLHTSNIQQSKKSHVLFF